MKPVSERKALVKLTRINDDLRSRVVREYEYRAKSCLTCETQGACCLDADFVNVRISKLEAVLIAERLKKLSPEHLAAVRMRIGDAIERYELSASRNVVDQRFACPLFEPSVGCLVHNSGKPIPCITHACYDDSAHLPPHEIASDAELKINRLNSSVYGSASSLLPLPVALKEWAL